MNKSSEITETEHDNWITALVDEMMEEYNEKQEEMEMIDYTYDFGYFYIDYNTAGQFAFYDEKYNWLVTLQPDDEYEFDFHLQHFYNEYVKGEKTGLQIYTQLITSRFKKWGQ